MKKRKRWKKEKEKREKDERDALSTDQKAHFRQVRPDVTTRF